MYGMRNMVILMAALTLAVAAYGGETYGDQSAAEKALGLSDNVRTGWSGHFIRRGGQTITYDETREYDHYGNLVASSWSQNSTTRSGTVAAVPIGDFAEFCAFSYRGQSRNGVGTVLTGKVVSVQIQISAGSSIPSEPVMQRAVENLVKTGVPLPATAGAKPGRILPILESAKRRFGARIAKARYDGKNGKVDVFLFDCQPSTADETFVPATPQGISRDERIQRAKSLKPDTDKGGTVYQSTVTEIDPYGSVRVPLEGTVR